MTIDLQSKVERQGDDAKILQNTVDALTRALRDLKTSSADTMMQLQQTTQQLAQRNDELRIASSLASDNANALSSSKGEVHRLTAALESASNDNLRLTEEIGNAALLSNELGDKVNLQTEEITALKDAAKTALQEFKAVRAAKKTADKEKQVIENEMKLLRSDYQGLDKEKQRLENELSKAQELQQTLKDMNTAMRVHRIGKTGSSLAKQYETDLMAEIDSLRNQLQSEQSASAKCSASLKAIKGAMHDAIMSLHCSLGLGMTIEDVDGAVSDGNTGATLGDVCEMVYVELSKKERAIRSQREALAQAENLASSYAIELSKAKTDISAHITDMSQARETISSLSEQVASAKDGLSSKEEELSNAALTISSQRREMHSTVSLAQQAAAHAQETLEASNSQARETISLLSEQVASAKAELSSKEEELSNAALTISSQRREMRATALAQQAAAHAQETLEASRPATSATPGRLHQDMPGQQFQHAGQLTRTSPYMIAGCSIVATAVTCLIGSRVIHPSRRRMRRDAD